MGYGDEIISSGFAKGMKAQGKRLALGDGKQIRWTQRAHIVLRGNPNVAPPGSEGASDLVWKAHYQGNRCYNRQVEGRWEWVKQPENGIVPGELYLDQREHTWAKFASPERNMILVEPNIPAFKGIKGNKSWPAKRYDKVFKTLRREGYIPVQIALPVPYGPGHESEFAEKVRQVPDIRHSFALLQRALAYVGPEGGMHHAAAALGIPAVVIFGGFISPEVTGYPDHVNLFRGGEPCGSLTDCEHCKQALLAITEEEVIEHALATAKRRR